LVTSAAFLVRNCRIFVKKWIIKALPIRYRSSDVDADGAGRMFTGHVTIVPGSAWNEAIHAEHGDPTDTCRWVTRGDDCVTDGYKGSNGCLNAAALIELLHNAHTYMRTCTDKQSTGINVIW
jgi:hypothetical protein